MKSPVTGERGKRVLNWSFVSFLPHPKSISDPVFSFNDVEWKRAPDPEEDKEGPFPSKGVDHDAEEEPVQQFRVGEEIERSDRRARLLNRSVKILAIFDLLLVHVTYQESRQVNPFLHTGLAGSS